MTATTGRLLLNDRASLSMLITVVPEDKVPSLVTGLRRLLEVLASRMRWKCQGRKSLTGTSAITGSTNRSQ